MILISVISLFLLTKMYYNFLQIQRIDKPSPTERTIYIEGVGSQKVEPNVVLLQFGMKTTGKTVSEAQADNTKTTNAFIQSVKDLGIEEEDLMTRDYSVNVNTVWDEPSKTYKEQGFTIFQSVQIKIKDKSKVPNVLALVGTHQVNHMSGPTYIVDGIQEFEAKAREKAIENAKEKIEILSKTIGLKIDRIIGYSEWREGDANTGGMYADMKMETQAPSFPIGTQEIKMHANITFLLKE